MYSWDTAVSYTKSLLQKSHFLSRRPPFHSLTRCCKMALLQYFYLKMKTKCMSGLWKLPQSSLKGPFSSTALSLLHIPRFTVKDHMHKRFFCCPSGIYLPKFSQLSQAHSGSCPEQTNTQFRLFIRLWIRIFFSPLHSHLRWKHCQKGFPIYRST